MATKKTAPKGKNASKPIIEDTPATEPTFPVVETPAPAVEVPPAVEIPAPVENAAPAVVIPVVVVAQQNGVDRPKPFTLAAKIWAIADAVSTEEQRPAKIKEVIDRAYLEGIGVSTTAVQYGKWRKFYGLVNQDIRRRADRPLTEEKNGIFRPIGGSLAGRIWEIADELTEKTGKTADREEVIRHGFAENINAATAITQYGKWQKFNGLGQVRSKKSANDENLDKKNDVVRPEPGSKAGRIWAIATTLSEKAGMPALRDDVMKAAFAEGLNVATIVTQYGKWKKYHGLTAPAKNTAS